MKNNLPCLCKRCRGNGEIVCPDCDGEGRISGVSLEALVVAETHPNRAKVQELQADAVHCRLMAERLSALNPEHSSSYNAQLNDTLETLEAAAACLLK